MTLQQLRYIVEVYKCGSITEAAHRLFIAQPSLSKAIKDVEDEFHITILKRGRHGASFTEDGMKFLQFAHRSWTRPTTSTSISLRASLRKRISICPYRRSTICSPSTR